MNLGYYYVRDLGDGDAAPQFFKDKEACDIAVSAEEQEYGYVLRSTTPISTEDFK